MALPEHLLTLAISQGGPLRTAQLREHLGDRGRRRALADDCVRLRRGVHVPVELWSDDPLRRAALTTCGRALVCEDAVVRARSAAHLLQIPLLGALPAVPELVRAPRGRDGTSSTPGLQVAPLPASHVTTVGGVLVTSLARTVVDLARTRPPPQGVVAADAAISRGLDPDALRQVAQACAGWPGGREALDVVAFADGRAETPLESVTRWAYASEGLPAPELQVEVRAADGTFLGLVDFLWRSQRVVGEADGMGKYDLPGAGRAEKVREKWLVRRAGLDLVRNDWDDAWQAAGRRDLGERVRLAFACAPLRPVVPGVRYVVVPLEELRRRRGHAVAGAGKPQPAWWLPDRHQGSSGG